jgi:hypothetical protein
MNAGTGTSLVAASLLSLVAASAAFGSAVESPLVIPAKVTGPKRHITTDDLARNASDVRDFSWSDDGKSLLFKVGTTREELARRAEAKAWSGYRLPEFHSLFRALGQGAPARSEQIRWLSSNPRR